MERFWIEIACEHSRMNIQRARFFPAAGIHDRQGAVTQTAFISHPAGFPVTDHAQAGTLSFVRVDLPSVLKASIS